MNALVMTAPGDLEVRTESIPEIDDQEVLIKVRACAIDRRDLDMYTDIRQWNGTTFYRFGRNATGIVELVGSSVTQWRPGDRVLVWGIQDGVADYCVAKASQIIRLPDSIGFEEGTIIQLLPAVIRGIEQCVLKDKTIFISGAGAVGMLCAQVARAYGAEKIIISDLHALRLKRILQTAADVGINASTEDVIRRIEEESDGQGIEVCIECTGVENSFRNCESSLRSNGHLIVVGDHYQPLAIDLLNWSERSLHLIMAQEPASETPGLLNKALHLVDVGVVTLRPLLTHVFPFHRASEALNLLSNDPARLVKVALVL